jgi:hypothetical protein
MDEMDRFNEGMPDKQKDKIKYLRRTIIQLKKSIDSLMKNPNKIRVHDFGAGDGPQSHVTNRELANEDRQIKKKAISLLNDITKEKMEDDPKNQTRDRNTGETKTKRIKTRTMSGGAGGRMMMPQEYSKRSLYKPKTN